MRTLFVCGALLLVYTTLLYPLGLAWRARRAARPIRRAFFQPPVTVILAVRNGERWIANKLESLLAQDYPRERVQILVLSDGSTDATEQIAESYAGRGVELVRLPRGGKPRALNAGRALARGELLFYTDVRQQLDPDCLARLACCFADPQVGAASGTLVIRDGRTQETIHSGLYWRYEIWIRHNLSRLDSIFGATGCAYMMRRELTVELPPDMLLDDVYQPLAAFFRGYRLIVDEQARAYDEPTEFQDEFRRKVRTLAGNYQILAAYPQLLTPRNRLWLHFVSTKLARLLLPFALLAVWFASPALPGPWGGLLFTAQCLFYGAALADPFLPERFVFKRVTSPIRAFTVLMVAALCAISILVVPPERLWSETRMANSRRQ